LAAIAESDDLHAWLIRGFVEAGLPDHTRGSPAWITSGALNLENFIQDQGASGILLQFLGVAGDLPMPEDEYTYQVVVVRGASGTQVVVQCPETLFSHAFPSQPREAIAGHILEQVRAHNDAFTAWRKKGGETTYGQRVAIPVVRGAACDRGLVTVLETLRRSNRSVVEGPANKWWGSDKPKPSMAIVAGLGQEPQYITKKAADSLSPEDIAHAGRLRTAGIAMIVSGVLGMGLVVIAFAMAGYNVYQVGFRGLFAQWWTLAGIGAGGLFACLHVFAGWRLRSLRSRGLVRVLAILGMLPCVTPCCAVGIPVGGWVLYLLHDARSIKVFND
jgi:hypothetical protein